MDGRFILLLAILLSEGSWAGQKMVSKLKHRGLSQKRGLTEAEEKEYLDEHNRLRSLQAQGKIPGQPAAADMIRLEWNSQTAEHAQVWADNCGGPMHGNHKRYGEGQNYVGHGDRKYLLQWGFDGWFDEEYGGYRYGQNPGSSGHYTQMVTAFSYEVGCGANACDGSAFGRVICNYRVSGNFYDNGKYLPPFKRGTACSKCPQGFGYCKDFLCTSSRVCRRGDSSCRCTVDANKCAKNGKYKAATCECTCKKGWTGLNCDEKCTEPDNKMCPSRAKKGDCKPSRQNVFYLDMWLNCRASCGKCEAADDGGSGGSGGGGGGGSCKDLFTNCADLRRQGNCQNHNKEWMRQKCPKMCGFCGGSGGGGGSGGSGGGGGGGSCKDLFTNCADLRRQRNCQNHNKEWMRQKCPKMCGFC